MNIDIKNLEELSKLSLEYGNLADEKTVKEQLETLIDKLRLPEVEVLEVKLKQLNAMELRPDVAKPSLKREEFLKNAPQSQSGCFVVPKTV